MKLRAITGVAYMATLIVFFVLKIFAHSLFFDALVYAFALIGTFEITRALKDKLTKAQTVLAFAFAVCCIPLTAVGALYSYGLQAAAISFALFAIANLALFVFDYDKTTVESVGVSVLSGVYPTVLLVLLVLANHLPTTALMEKYAFNSTLALLMIFIVSPCADVSAYMFGKFLRGKYPKKMAEKISPNKTLVGGIGGFVGGFVGAILLYFIYNAVCGTFENMAFWLFGYGVIGVLSAGATEFGDLVESAIKRKVGIKDMGKLLPGHGGILDRIDGTLFAALPVYLAFVLAYLVTL